MSAQLAKKLKLNASVEQPKKAASRSKKAEELEARRRLESCLEEKRLSRELAEFDFEY
jgi:hypothetical protein